MSIVIPTHNRPEKLATLLRSIQDHWNPAIESVIVVDDSDRPSELSQTFHRLPLNHIVQKPRMYISRAKNLGWRAARSPFVYFIDDDNIVTPTTFQVPLDRIVSSPTIGAVVPAVLYRSEPNLVWVYATPLSPGRWGHTLIGRNRPRDGSLENRVFETDAMPNAALVRRSALSDIDGFDESLRVNSSAAAALRLKEKGWEVLAHTGAFILHDVEPPGRLGYWARHGVIDPSRVYHEVRDWFSLMRSLHPGQTFFSVRATFHASGFMVPNGLSYMLGGGAQGHESLKQLIRGYLSSLRPPHREGSDAR